MTIINSQDELEAGTGFMLALPERLRDMESRGYTENLVMRYDHFECQSGAIKIYPKDVVVDALMRFENTSDPDDQCILYAIANKNGSCKGVFIESYGLYHEELSPEMIKCLQNGTHSLTFH